MSAIAVPLFASEDYLSAVLDHPALLAVLT
jgi:hypothetical protein